MNTLPLLRTMPALAAAAFLLCSTPAFASGNTARSSPHYCSRNSVSNSEPGSGTNGGTLGIKTNVSSSEANPAAAPVQPNTPANTNANNINSGNPGVHAKSDPCKAYYRTRHHHSHSSSSTGH